MLLALQCLSCFSASPWLSFSSFSSLPSLRIFNFTWQGTKNYGVGEFFLFPIIILIPKHYYTILKVLYCQLYSTVYLWRVWSHQCQVIQVDPRSLFWLLIFFWVCLVSLATGDCWLSPSGCCAPVRPLRQPHPPLPPLRRSHCPFCFWHSPSWFSPLPSYSLAFFSGSSPRRFEITFSS